MRIKGDSKKSAVCIVILMRIVRREQRRGSKKVPVLAAQRLCR